MSLFVPVGMSSEVHKVQALQLLLLLLPEVNRDTLRVKSTLNQDLLLSTLNGCYGYRLTVSVVTGPAGLPP